MASCVVCPLCSEPGSLRAAMETATVPCNVRALTKHTFTVWRCSGCNSLHSAEDADLDYYYERFPFQKHQLDFHARIGYANRLRMLRKRGVKRSDLILDYGCGAGLFVQYLREKGYSRAFGYDRFVPAYSDASVLRQQYDVIVSHDVIEHVDDPREFLSEMTELLRPNGLLVIGTPNADHVRLDRDQLLTPELSQPYHRHILSERALLDLADEHGFAPEHTYRRFYFDSLLPGVNTRFMWAYIAATGGMIDAAVEPPQMGKVFGSLRLVLYALFGYFMPVRGCILVSFRYANAERRPAKLQKAIAVGSGR